MFGTNHQELPEGAEYIKPGIQENTVIKRVELKDANTEKPYFEVDFQIAGSDKNGIKTERFYVSEKAVNLNMNKFYEIVKAIVGNKADNVEAGSVKEYLDKVTPMILNKSYTQKFGGREYLNDKGEVKVSATIPVSRKTEKNPNPSIAVSSNSNGELTFNEDSDITRLVKKYTPVENSTNATSWEGS
jgi:hypothetical protein